MATTGSIVLTGATSGIGLAAARRLAPSARAIVLHGPEDADTVAPLLDSLRAVAPDTTIHYVGADFRELRAIESLAAQVAEHLEQVDALVNNAAIPGPPDRELASSGVELTFHVNYLAGALLTNLLLPRMPPTGRVVNVASATHLSAMLDLDDLRFDRRTYAPTRAYAQSKLAVVTYSCWLAPRVPQSVVSLHPGVISTRLLHSMFGSGGAPVAQGGDNVAAAVSADVPSGSYLDETDVASPNRSAAQPDLQQQLHDSTASLLGRDIV